MIQKSGRTGTFAELITKAVDLKLSSIRPTDLFVSTIYSVKPLQLQVDNVLRVGASFLDVSSQLINSDVPSDLPQHYLFKANDRVRVIRFREGQRYFILENLENGGGTSSEFIKKDNFIAGKFINLTKDINEENEPTLTITNSMELSSEPTEQEGLKALDAYSLNDTWDRISKKGDSLALDGETLSLMSGEQELSSVTLPQQGGIKVIDSLDSSSTTDALSANQGRILAERTYDSGWIEATYGTNWRPFTSGDYYGLSYRLKDGVVYFRGLASPINTTSNSVVFTIPNSPVNMIPSKRIVLMTTKNNDLNARLDVLANGEVRVISSVNAGGWLSVNCSFALDE